jgi:hypothetical protein
MCRTRKESIQKTNRISLIWKRPVVNRRQALILFISVRLKIQAYIFEALLQGKEKTGANNQGTPEGFLPD